MEVKYSDYWWNKWGSYELLQKAGDNKSKEKDWRRKYADYSGSLTDK